MLLSLSISAIIRHTTFSLSFSSKAKVFVDTQKKVTLNAPLDCNNPTK